MYYHSLKFSLLFQFFFFIVFVRSFAQSMCPNSDFSQGNFNDWSAFYGDFYNPHSNSGLIEGRHTIMYSPAITDPYTCGGLSTIPQGYMYSARLGNANVNAEAEQLSYSLQVTPETNLFIYKYAVVLQDPNHVPEEQPSFTIEVTKQDGQIIDPVCGYYYVYAQQGMPSWHSCNDVVWKDWTTVGIDLSPYIGQTVSIVFTTRDCEQKGHFGYAYISAICSKLQIVFGYCPRDTIATVTAPPGFQYLWDNGETAQSRIIQNPVMGMKVNCKLTAVNGCEVDIDGVFQPTLVTADFHFPPTCDGTPVLFEDSSTINQNQIVNRTWDFGDSTAAVINALKPEHTFPRDGTYLVRLIASSTDGCPDTITKNIQIVPVPKVQFSIPNTCSSKNLVDTLYYHTEIDLMTNAGNDHYNWSTGDTTLSIHITEEGWYQLTIDNQNLCYARDSVYLSECYVDLFMPNAFSANNDLLNDVFLPLTHPEKISHFVMNIYSRWGQLIYQTQDVRKGWDGKVNDDEVLAGVYVYFIRYEVPSGEQKTQRGTVTLLR